MQLYGILLAHYALRWLMHQAALRADIDPDRLSFVHAVEVIRDAVMEFQLVALEQQEQLYDRLLHDIASKRLPNGGCAAIKGMALDSKPPTPDSSQSPTAMVRW